MANYVLGNFGDDMSLTSSVGFDYTAGDVSTQPTDPGVTTASAGSSGAGSGSSGWDWNAIATGGIGLATGIVKAFTPTPTQTVPGLSTKPATGGAGALAIGGGTVALLGLGVLAVVLLAKKK